MITEPTFMESHKRIAQQGDDPRQTRFNGLNKAAIDGRKDEIQSQDNLEHPREVLQSKEKLLKLVDDIYSCSNMALVEISTPPKVGTVTTCVDVAIADAPGRTGEAAILGKMLCHRATSPIAQCFLDAGKEYQQRENIHISNPSSNTPERLGSNSENIIDLTQQLQVYNQPTKRPRSDKERDERYQKAKKRLTWLQMNNAYLEERSQRLEKKLFLAEEEKEILEEEKRRKELEKKMKEREAKLAAALAINRSLITSSSDLRHSLATTSRCDLQRERNRQVTGLGHFDIGEIPPSPISVQSPHPAFYSNDGYQTPMYQQSPQHHFTAQCSPVRPSTTQQPSLSYTLPRPMTKSLDREKDPRRVP